MRLRTLMLAVAVSGIALGSIPRHVQGVVRDYDDFAPAVLFFEVIVLSVFLVPLLALAFVVRVARQDHAYAASLSRRLPIEWRDPTHAEESPPARP